LLQLAHKFSFFIIPQQEIQLKPFAMLSDFFIVNVVVFLEKLELLSVDSLEATIQIHNCCHFEAIRVDSVDNP